MKTFYSREEDKVAEQVVEAVKNGETVEWHTKYETFYGVSWSNWATKKLEEIPCDIQYKDRDKWEGYWRTLIITPKK